LKRIFFGNIRVRIRNIQKVYLKRFLLEVAYFVILSSSLSPLYQTKNPLSSPKTMIYFYYAALAFARAVFIPS